MSSDSVYSITGWVAIGLLAISIVLVSYNKTNYRSVYMRTLGQSLMCLATISVGIGLLSSKSPPPPPPPPAPAPAAPKADAPAPPAPAAPAPAAPKADAPAPPAPAAPAPAAPKADAKPSESYDSKNSIPKQLTAVVPIDQQLDAGLIEYHDSETFKKFKPTFHGQ